MNHTMKSYDKILIKITTIINTVMLISSKIILIACVSRPEFMDEFWKRSEF